MTETKPTNGLLTGQLNNTRTKNRPIWLTIDGSKPAYHWWQTLHESSSQYHHRYTDQSRSTDQTYNIIDWQTSFTWLWRWLPLRLSKCQSPTAVLFRTTLTRTITLYELQKLKSYQFFFEGNVKRLESKAYQGKTYVKASVLPSMKKNPYRILVEFSPQCDILREACTCPAGLGRLDKGKCNHVGGVLFAIKTSQGEDCKNTLNHCRARHGCLYGLCHATKVSQQSH